MKIDPTNVVKLYETGSAKNAAGKSGGAKSRDGAGQTGDRLEISEAASKHSEIASAKSAIIKDVEKGASPEKLHQLKVSIENGTYRVSARDIAAAMLNKK